MHKNSNSRVVWILPLELENCLKTAEEFIKKQEVEQKRISKLSFSEIEERAKKANKIPKFQ